MRGSFLDVLASFDLKGHQGYQSHHVPKISQRCPQDVIEIIIERINGLSENLKSGRVTSGTLSRKELLSELTKKILDK